MPDVNDDIPKQTESGTLDEEDSRTVAQQNVGKDNVIGGGEWPDPDTPPRGPAPGVADTDVAAEVATERAHNPGQFKKLLEEDPERGGSATAPPDDR